MSASVYIKDMCTFVVAQAGRGNPLALGLLHKQGSLQNRGILLNRTECIKEYAFL